MLKVTILMIVVLIISCDKVLLENEPCDSELVELLLLKNVIESKRDSLWDEQYKVIKKIDKLTRAQKKIRNLVNKN